MPTIRTIVNSRENDSAILNINAHEQLCDLLEEGLNAEKIGELRSFDDVICDLRKELN